MFQDRDWMMRMVKQLVDLLARVMKLKNKPEEALEALENGCESLLEIDFPTLALVDSASGAKLLKDSPHQCLRANSRGDGHCRTDTR